ncbi:MAG: TIGR00296 family protein [Candidatus Njordarchaeia archaeon]
MNEITDEHGIFIVKLARRAVEEWVTRKVKIQPPEDAPKILYEKAGVFVTLNRLHDKEEELRGCIGYIIPIKPLVEAVIDVAISAATEDPRFPPIEPRELDSIIVEVTVLTPPTKIEVEDPQEYLQKITIGKDGLIVKYGPFSGTLLPQVPIEYNWDVKTFLEHLCWKAGLEKDCWKNKKVEIYKYQGAIWKELKPNGEVIKVELIKS